MTTHDTPEAALARALTLYYDCVPEEEAEEDAEEDAVAILGVLPDWVLMPRVKVAWLRDRADLS